MLRNIKLQDLVSLYTQVYGPFVPSLNRRWFIFAFLLPIAAHLLFPLWVTLLVFPWLITWFLYIRMATRNRWGLWSLPLDPDRVRKVTLIFLDQVSMWYQGRTIASHHIKQLWNTRKGIGVNLGSRPKPLRGIDFGSKRSRLNVYPTHVSYFL